MLEAAIALMAIAETRHNGYVDVPPSEITLEIYEELIKCGLSLSRSDALWMNGWRVYSVRAMRSGLYREYIPKSIHTRIASPDVRVPSLEEIEDITQTEFPAEDLNGMRNKSCMD
jgi:hypothetical protein